MMKKILIIILMILILGGGITLFFSEKNGTERVNLGEYETNTRSIDNIPVNHNDFSNTSIDNIITVRGMIELSNFSDMRTNVPDQLKDTSTIFFIPDAESDFSQWVLKTHPTRNQNNLPRLFLGCTSDGIHGHAELLGELSANTGELSTGFRGFSFEPIDFTLPPNTTGYHTVTITMPLMFLDKVKNVDLPDRARPGDCTADSKIISIDNQVIVYK